MWSNNHADEVLVVRGDSRRRERSRAVGGISGCEVKLNSMFEAFSSDGKPALDGEHGTAAAESMGQSRVPLALLARIDQVRTIGKQAAGRPSVCCCNNNKVRGCCFSCQLVLTKGHPKYRGVIATIYRFGAFVIGYKYTVPRF